MSAKTMRVGCVAGSLLATVLCAPASGQTLAEIAAEMDRIDRTVQTGMEALTECDDSFEGVVATKPGDDDSLERWQAYAENIAQWYVACRALAAGDPRPALMKLLETLLAKLPPAPSGPNAVDPAKDLRERGEHLEQAIEMFGVRWVATNLAWAAQRALAEAAIRVRQRNGR